MASKPEKRAGSQGQDDGLTNQTEQAVEEEEGEEEEGEEEEGEEEEGEEEEGEEEEGEEEEGEEEEGEEEDEDDEPKLKYARLTGSLGGVYRNGDATSAFLVGGDKMIIGTHNGNIHVLALPNLQTLRVYHAHSASVTAVSISPFPPPIPNPKSDAAAIKAAAAVASHLSPGKPGAASGGSPAGKSPLKQPPVLATASNSIYIGTASIDGNVCVSSLVDPKDVLLRNFARPVQAIALSPAYKNDRTYLSGGLAGNLVLTVGGRAGTSSTSSTTGSAAAQASGWLSTVGLSTNTGKDNVLHSGEGAISLIKWSRSGDYVVWINEQGIKIMRSNLHLESEDLDAAWKRISHVDRPRGSGWEEMSTVWKGRAEWVDERGLEADDEPPSTAKAQGPSSPAASSLKALPVPSKSNAKRPEKLIVGWGGTVWIINVHPSTTGVGKNVGEKTIGRAEIVNILRTDCIISGLSLYTPSLLVLLAYIVPDENNPKATFNSSPETTPRRGVHRRQNALSPELHLIDINTSEEISTDSLTMSRFETLSATDYHLGILPALRKNAVNASQRGAFEAIGGSLWTAGTYATGMFTSAASVLSSDSKSGSGKVSSSFASKIQQQANLINPQLASLGMKIFIQSPYDCVLATKRDLADHLSFLLEREKFKEAWELLNDHPEIISTEASDPESDDLPVTPTKTKASSDDFYADDASATPSSTTKNLYSAVEKEKRRIGELWLEQLVNADEWPTAAAVCAKVLTTSSRWDHWIWVFIEAKRIEEITPFIPTKQLKPPLSSLIFEVVLGHYIAHDRLRLKEILEEWPAELFDIKSVTTALEGKLETDEVREDTVEGGERGRDWRILTEGVARLLLADGRPREALKYYVRLKDAETAMGLIKDYHLLDAVADDIPGLILLRVSEEQMRTATIDELEEASSETIKLLVDEAQHSIVRPDIVVTQLLDADRQLFLFFYFRSLWRSDGSDQNRLATDRITTEGKALVEEFGDLVVDLFAEYDRPLLMEFFKSSQSYNLEKATAVCDARDYIPEQVYLLSKTGQTKRALFLIIDQLHDVSGAITFAKEQDDPALWDDLLEYSMDKPRFIRGLLEEVGTAIDPITLVRRIPEGLQVEGLKDGLGRMIKEYEIQWSISEGVARVLRGEVAMGMDKLRTGQRRGVKFDVTMEKNVPMVKIDDVPVDKPDGAEDDDNKATKRPKSGECVGCHDHFREDEKETLIGFVCGHIFHLSCLLDYEHHPERKALIEFGVTEDTGSFLRSVGTKVTHARLIRDHVGGGCPLELPKGDDV